MSGDKGDDAGDEAMAAVPVEGEPVGAAKGDAIREALLVLAAEGEEAAAVGEGATAAGTVGEEEGGAAVANADAKAASIGFCPCCCKRLLGGTNRDFPFAFPLLLSLAAVPAGTVETAAGAGGEAVAAVARRTSREKAADSFVAAGRLAATADAAGEEGEAAGAAAALLGDASAIDVFCFARGGVASADFASFD
jgi:hypothetical protein